MVGKNYQKPNIQLPHHWMTAHKTIPTTLVIEKTWWEERFHDPVLNTLVEKAMHNNYDIMIANERIREARENYYYVAADQGPMLNFQGDSTREANQIAFPANLAPAGIQKPFNIYQVGFDASWEIDLFGKQKQTRKAYRATLEATQASQQETCIRLLAEVARTYVSIREYQQQIIIAKKQSALERSRTKIFHEQVKVGRIEGIQLSKAFSEEQQTKTQLPYYENLLAQAEFNMDILLGQTPGATHLLVTPPKIFLPFNKKFNKKLILLAPARVIANRPDIRIAERQLAAATFEHNVAIADQFPDISLSGFLGLLNVNASHLLQASSRSWSTGMNALWPLFNNGKSSAAIHAADARQHIARTSYQKTIIAALSDVNRAISAFSTQEDDRVSLEKIMSHKQRELKVAQQRYQEGLSSLLNVLDAQYAYYTAKSKFISSNAMAIKNLIAVYKSLGGGFTNEPISTALS